MKPNQNAAFHIDDAYEHDPTPRILQADRFEVLVAASEAENIYSGRIADRLSERWRVSS